MKITFRYLGVITHQIELSPEKGDYTIGRNQENDIRLAHDFISRNHGRIFYENDKWYYRDLRSDHPNHQTEIIELTHTKAISLEEQLDLVTNDYLNQSQTKIFKIDDLKKKELSYRNIWVASFFFILFLGGGGYLIQKSLMPMNSSQLLSFSQKRFVEFQLKKDPILEKELITSHGFKSEDFKETVGFCSGFLIAPKTVMTASHCLLGASGINPTSNFELKTFDGKKHQIDEVLGLDISRDIIVVKAESLSDYSFFNFKESHKIGEPVFTVGNVHGEGIAIRDGTISSVTKDPNNPKIEFIRYTAATSPGNSGGPLIDQTGNVVGLVFARSNAAENYNLSAPYYTLEKFVSLVEEKIKNGNHYQVEIDTEKLIFGSHLTQEYFNSQLLPPALYSHKFFRKREVGEKLNKIKFELELPRSFEEFKSEITKNAMSELRLKISELKDEIKKQNKPGADWTTQITKKHPLLVPRNLDDSLLTLDELTEDFVWEKNILILEPGFYAESSVDDQTYIANFIDNNFPKNFDLKRRSQFPQYLRTQMESFSSVFGQETSLVMLDYTSDEAVQLNEMSYQEAFQYEEAFNMNAFEVPYPFIRPKKKKNLKIKHLNFEKEEEATDQFGRIWRITKAQPLKGIELYRYCLSYPQAQMCFNSPIQSEQADLISMIKENYVKNYLSHRILDLNFWGIDSLVNYLNDSPSYEFSDFRIDQSDKNKQIEYTYFNLKYNLHPSAKMIKVLPAVLKDTNGDSRWVTIGHQTYHPKTKNQPAMICRSEIDFPKLRTSYLAGLYHKNKKLDIANKSPNDRKVANTSAKDKIHVRSFKTKKWKHELKIYQACREVYKEEYDKGYHMGEFLNPPDKIF